MATVTSPNVLPDAHEAENRHRRATRPNEALIAKLRADSLSAGMTDA
jgi:hypothetical protein